VGGEKKQKQQPICGELKCRRRSSRSQCTSQWSGRSSSAESLQDRTLACSDSVPKKVKHRSASPNAEIKKIKTLRGGPDLRASGQHDSSNVVLTRRFLESDSYFVCRNEVN